MLFRSNTNRLVQVAEEIAGTKAVRVADVTEIRPEWLLHVRKVGVTSGASTPTPITKEVIAYLEQFDPANPDTWKPVRTVDKSKLLPPVKEKSGSAP